MTETNESIFPKKRSLSYVHHASSHPFDYQTPACTFDHFTAHHPEHECFIFKAEDKRYTYSTFQHEVNSVAHSLLQLGLKENDRVVVALPTVSESVVLNYVASKLGFIKVNMDLNSIVRYWIQTLTKVKCKAMVIPSSDVFIDKMRQVLAHFDEQPSECTFTLQHLILIGSKKTTDSRDVLWYNDLLKKGSIKNRKDDTTLCERQMSINPDSPLSITMTSGSTGTPKAVLLTNFAALNIALIHWNHFGPFCSRYCVSTSTFHISAGIWASFLPAASKCTVIFPNFQQDVLATMRAIAEEKCTGLSAPPAHFREILAHADRDKYDLTSLQYASLSSTSVKPELLPILEAQLGIVRARQRYGLSEGGCLLTSGLYADSHDERRYTSVGRCLPHVEMKLVDAQGQLVAIGCEGEVYVRSRLIMHSYYNDPVLTAEAINNDGWLKTGDLARMDEDGYVFFLGRKHEVIFRATRHIYPIEVEHAIYEHPNVSEVHVFSIPDPDVEEVVCAFVKLKANCQCEVEELKTFLLDKVNPFKIPTHIQFVDHFPRTATGKVPKYQLSQLMIQLLN